MVKQLLAFDFGASSGRAVLATIDGEKILLKEIHRFSNDPVLVSNTLYWDVLRLFHEIKQSIIIAKNLGGFDAIGIDTWAVDFGLINGDGELIANPVHYRDKRTDNIAQEFLMKISRSEIFNKTGIAFLKFNTLYQLFYLSKYQKEKLDLTSKVLMIPDLFAYFLTGEIKAELTNASTTNLLNAHSKNWDQNLLDLIGVKRSQMPEIIQPTKQYGLLSPSICEELGCSSVPVIAVCTHDTASAVVSVPTNEEFLFISCGTWSLFGTELNHPIINSKSLKENFTNEVGFDSTTRFLKNIMGLWLIQELKRTFNRQGKDYSYADMEKLAKTANSFKYFIDVDYADFEKPGDMVKKVKDYCKQTGQEIPETDAEIIRVVYESLALKYKETYLKIKELTFKEYSQINMVGGGTQDTFLCQLTADATGCKVVAGPVEATVLGNVCVQLISLGEIESLEKARKLVANSTELKSYIPTNTNFYDRIYIKYLSVINQK